MHFLPWQWALAIFASLLFGLSKTGFSGASILGVAILAQLMPADVATGAVLPLLICADVIAVTAYRKHAVWSHLWRMFPWAAAGVIAGYFAMDYVKGSAFNKLIGGLLLAMALLQFVRQWQAKKRPVEETTQVVTAHPVTAAFTGITAGFTTLIANAAGPVMQIYLLAMRLPKWEFIGTGAWFFFVINLFKVPFMVGQGRITMASSLFDLKLAAFTILGALFGKYLIKIVNQPLFEALALIFVVIGSLRLLF